MCSRSSPPLSRRRRSGRIGRPHLGEVGHALIVAVALVATARTASAQIQIDWRVDAAASRVTPAGGDSRNAVSLSGHAQQQIGQFTPRLSGAATVAGDSVAAAQLVFGVRAIPPWSARMPIDVGALFALYGITAGDRGQSRVFYARQHGVLERSGWWIGAAYAQIDRATAFSSNAVDVAVWIMRGQTQFLAALATSRTDDRGVFEQTDLAPDDFANKYRVADGTFTIQHTRTRLEFETVAGVRYALEGLEGTRTFAAMSVAWRLRQGLHVIFSGGNQLADPLRGTPEWRFVSAGLRFGNSTAAPRSAEGRLGPVLRFERTDGASVRFLLEAPATATRVEIAGTMTGWESVAMTLTSRGWEVIVPAVAGPHRVRVRVDGAEWLPPAGLQTIADEFGRSGSLILPRMR